MYEFIEVFKTDLRAYSPDRLRMTVKDGVWSLGEMYDHLIAVADEYLGHIETCAQANEEQPLGKTKGGEDVFRTRAFPPIRIKLEDTPENTPSSRETRETLLAGLERVERDMQAWERRLDGLNPRHKVLHDGFGWLNAQEWFALIGYHFRHHLRQKAELEQWTRVEG
jgi:DinB superfamily